MNQKWEAQRKYLNTVEAANYLGFSKSKLYKMVSGREIPHYKLNNYTLLFKQDELDEYLDQNVVKVLTVSELEKKASNIDTGF